MGIAKPMLRPLPTAPRASHPRPPPSLPEAGPGTPHARILPQEVGNTWDPKTPIHVEVATYLFNNPKDLLVSANSPNTLAAT